MRLRRIPEDLKFFGILGEKLFETFEGFNLGHSIDLTVDIRPRVF
jgi:hypothetical protein